MLIESIKKVVGNTNFKNGILYTVFSFINSGFSFILILILAKYLAPGEYGQLNLFTTFVTLVNIIITLCTVSYVPVSFFRRGRRVVRHLILISLGVATCMLLMFSIIIILFPNLIQHCLGFPVTYIWAGLFICYFQVFNALNLDIWRLEEKPIRYGIYSLSFAVCNFILSFILVVNLNLGWSGRVDAWFILGLLYFLISILFLVKRKYLIVSPPPISLIKETLFFSIPLVPHSLSFWLKQGMDRYIINYFYDSASVGYFSFALNIAAIIGIVGSAFNATNSVYLYKKLSLGYEKVKSSLTKQTTLMTIVFLLVSIGVAVFAWVLITYFLPKYTNSLQYILPLAIGAFGQCLYLLWVNYLFFFKRTKQLMYITFSTALVQLLLSLILTRFSIQFTAYISMTISLVTFLSIALYAQRLLKGELKKSSENLVNE